VPPRPARAAAPVDGDGRRLRRRAAHLHIHSLSSRALSSLPPGRVASGRSRGVVGSGSSLRCAGNGKLVVVSRGGGGPLFIEEEDDMAVRRRQAGSAHACDWPAGPAAAGCCSVTRYTRPRRRSGSATSEREPARQVWASAAGPTLPFTSEF
jgi:hypothetical protein